MADPTSPPGEDDTPAGDEFDWLSLDSDEEIVWAGNPHPMSIVPALIFGIPLAILLVGIVVIVGAYLWRENTYYVVTTDGVYKKTGIFSRSVTEIEYEKIQNTAYSASAMGRWLGYGTVEISTAGGSGVEMRIQGVENPQEVQQRLSARVTEVQGTDDEESTADVLDDILVELRAIRQSVEAGSQGQNGFETGDR